MSRVIGPEKDLQPQSAGCVEVQTAFATINHAKADFSACPQFFANARSPEVMPRPTDRALCYDAFAILHSGESKTPVFVAEKVNWTAVTDADEKPTNRFFPDARLRLAERALLDDYNGSGNDRGHMQYPVKSILFVKFANEVA